MALIIKGNKVYYKYNEEDIEIAESFIKNYEPMTIEQFYDYTYNLDGSKAIRNGSKDGYIKHAGFALFAKYYVKTGNLPTLAEYNKLKLTNKLMYAGIAVGGGAFVLISIAVIAKKLKRKRG